MNTNTLNHDKEFGPLINKLSPVSMHRLINLLKKELGVENKNSSTMNRLVGLLRKELSRDIKRRTEMDRLIGMLRTELKIEVEGSEEVKKNTNTTNTSMSNNEGFQNLKEAFKEGEVVMETIKDKDVLLDIGLLTKVKSFSCTVTYDERNEEHPCDIELTVTTDSDEVDQGEVKELISQMLRSSFDDGVFNIMFMMKYVEVQEVK